MEDRPPHRADRQRLRDYVYPIIGHLPIADIKVAEAKQVLAPIWTRRIRPRRGCGSIMEDVTNWAIHEGIRADEMQPVGRSSGSSSRFRSASTR